MTKIAFIGAGQMAEALIKGLIKAQLFLPSEITASDINEARLKQLSDTYAINTTPSNVQAAKAGEIVLLAVKPQHIQAVVAEIGQQTSSSQVIVSIAAGIRLAKIKPYFKHSQGLVRVMPNTPALVGAGMSVIAFEPHLAAGIRQKIKAIFEAIGEVAEANEEIMDVVTAISGSGPAYYFLFCQTLAKAGIAAGLPADIAYHLSRQTFYGSALLLKQKLNEEELIKKVASPGGTTEAALKKFAALGLEKIVQEAVSAAIARGKELSKLV